MEFLSFLYLPFGFIFRIFYDLVSNYGLALFLFTFIPADSSPLLHQPAKGHGKADAVAAENQKTARKI